MATGPRRVVTQYDDEVPLDDFDYGYSGQPSGASFYVGVCIEEETEAHRPAHGINGMQWNLWVGEDDDDDY